MYRVEKLVDGARVRLGVFETIDIASQAIDADTQVNGPDVVYYVEREGK